MAYRTTWLCAGALLIFAGCPLLFQQSVERRQTDTRQPSGEWRELKEKRIQPHGIGIGALAFSRDGRLLASGSSDDTVRVMRLPPAEDFLSRRIDFLCRLQGHIHPVTFAAFASSGEIITSGQDETVRRWQIPEGKQLELTIKEDAGPVALSPDGQILAVGDSLEKRDPRNEIRLLSTSDGQLLQTLKGDKYFFSVAFSPDGKLIATGSAGKVQLWAVSDGRMLQSSDEHDYGVWHLAFSPDSKLLASGEQEGGAIYLWRLQGLVPLHKLWFGHTIIDLEFSADSELLATCSGSDDIPSNWLQLWRVADGKRLQVLVDEPPSAGPVAFSPKGNLLAVGMSDGTIRFFSP